MHNLVPRIALDVGQDKEFFDNPDLPETRSEMALPLMVGDNPLGAIDIQSKEESAFSEDDIDVLQVLANQVAVAINNAILIEEKQTALDQIQSTYLQESQRAWRELNQQINYGFISSLEDKFTRESTIEWSPEMIRASQNKKMARGIDKTIAIPITLRDEVLGVVRLQKENGQPDWTGEEIDLMETLIDQLEVALESARLYSETQRRATREQMVTEITSKIRSSIDPEEMLQTAVRELKQAFAAQRVQVLVQSPPNE
jgi:GAF domain-containing protein